MKTTSKSIFTAIAAVTMFMVCGSLVSAATFEVGYQNTIGSEQHPDATSEGGPYNVSVNPNNPGYAAYVANDTSGNPIAPYQRSFTAPVQGWSFVGGGTNNELTVAQESGGLITYKTTDDTFDSFGQNQRLLWETTDPGTDLLNPAEPADFTGPGYRSFGQIATSCDISGLQSGTVNIFYGAFGAIPTVSAVMKDTSGVAPDRTIEDAHLNGDYANRGEYYVAELDFVTDGNYDVIEYTWLANGVDDTGNGRFGGTVLTAALIPEPSTTLILALFGLLGVCFRRRRRN